MSSRDSPPFDPAADYPIGERRPDLVTTVSGLPLAAVNVDAVLRGEITGDDLRIGPEALARQGEVAEVSGRPALLPNFARAAEMTRIPDGRLLAMYEALRPRRSTSAELEAIAAELELVFAAPLTAALVREAAVEYARRGLFPPASDDV